MSGHMPWRKLHDAHRAEKRDDRAGWAATIECAGEPEGDEDAFPDQILAFAAALDPNGGAISSSVTCDRYGATFSVYTDSPSVPEVVDLALRIFHEGAANADLPPWCVVQCEVKTFAEQDADLAR